MKRLIKELAIKVPIVAMWCSCLPNWDECNTVERILIAFIGCVSVDAVRWGLKKD